MRSAGPIDEVGVGVPLLAELFPSVHHLRLARTGTCLVLLIDTPRIHAKIRRTGTVLVHRGHPLVSATSTKAQPSHHTEEKPKTLVFLSVMSEDERIFSPFAFFLLMDG